MRPLPNLIHADWSVASNKRWLCSASAKDGCYELEEARPAGPIPALVQRLLAPASVATIAGFDFPIGIPLAYAKAAGIERFPVFLRDTESTRWGRFLEVARTADEICVGRPFYPMQARKGVRRSELVSGLGLTSFQDLLRQCEFGHSGRSNACPIFWTLGANQVGKAALVGWNDVIRPLMFNHGVSIWPFDGDLDQLLQRSNCVIVESYPAEAAMHIGLPPFGGERSKRSEVHRKKCGKVILSWAKLRGVRISKALGAQLNEGWGPAESGEDPFDAVLGLVSMVEVLLGYRSAGAPDVAAVRNVEGWIFGLNALSPPKSQRLDSLEKVAMQ